MSVDLEAAMARAEAIWTDERLAELARRRQDCHYPQRADITWLRSLGVYDVPRSAP